MPVHVRPDGPIPARLMIVGEAPGAEEEAAGIPFVGASGQELNRMLGEARLDRNQIFVTNVARERPLNNDISQFIYESKAKNPKVPPGFTRLRDKFVTKQIHEGTSLLFKEIEAVKPNIIIPVGNVPLWALTGKWGITKWRGSMLQTDSISPTKVLPTYHPAAVLRQWDWRPTVVNDLKRAARFQNGEPYPKPSWNFIIRPGFKQVIDCLEKLLNRASRESFRLSFDLETRAGHIACAGLSWSLVDAICIPFMCVESRDGYWIESEESAIVFKLYQLLTHPNCLVVGQNILYDSQYTYRHWHFVPNVFQDCMISQHSIFSSQPKSLAHQASMYCDYYVYWKDEGKEWDKHMGEESLWYYNCEDCVYTDECGLTELEIVRKMGLESVHNFQQSMLWPVLQTMQRGVRIDLAKRAALTAEVQIEITRREDFLRSILGHPINPRSPKQMHSLFYDDLQQPVIMTRAKKGVPARATLNDDALQTISLREPILKPIINAISDIRTMGIFLSNFLEATLDDDDRMRTAYNIGGSASGKSAPVTYRLSSSENAFGTGTNLQNIPSKKSKSIGKAVARGGIAGLGDAYSYPNIRSMFIPDEGYTFFDGDLDRADLQVVVWESDDQMLKTALRMGADIHLLNSYVLVGKEPPPLEELVETHPRYPDLRAPYQLVREFAKVFCHGTNYGGGARTMAANTGRTIHEIDRAQKIWFGAHPGIKTWQDRIKAQALRHRFVENKFGYRWYIFDRIDSIIPEAIAWIPQSTVSVVINKIWRRIFTELPDVQVLLQVHDSLAGQFPTSRPELASAIKECAKVVIPYDDPLTIPFGLKTSTTSWGHCA